ncbi:hypothetical protein IQ288_34905 [Burkholderia sp. R-69980]|nr:hypothetical protein [Burkholderia sp. R-69980]
MRTLCAALLATVTFFVTSITHATATGDLPFDKTTIAIPSGTATVIALKRAARADPTLAAKMDEIGNSFGIVFVPGILGSALQDDQGVIWGQQDIGQIAFHYKDFVSRLALPPELIDENARSSVRASVLDTMIGMDFYGKAVKAMQQTAVELHVGFVACGYDWRRDIRAGAGEIDRCINNYYTTPHRLIVIAHSMGGLVAWQWAMKNNLASPDSRQRIVQIVTLGTPFEGSCDLVRMIEKGYIQPDHNKYIDNDNRQKPASPFEQFATLVEKIKDAAVNDASATLTQSIRPLILTWPGALELTPKPTDRAHAENCIAVPPPGPDADISRNVSYYDPAFWALPVAHELLLRDYPLPHQYAKVLAKAKEFRNGFTPAPLGVPTWLYFSQRWEVPNQRDIVVGPHGESVLGHSALSPDGWETQQGDGRVPLNSANIADSPEQMFSRHLGVLSAHGDLPADANFQKDYLHSRLPEILDTLLAVAIADASATHPEWLQEYVAASGVRWEPADVRATLAPGHPDAATVAATDTVSRFDDSICRLDARQCPKTLAGAVAAIKKLGDSPFAAIVNFGNLAETLGDAHRDYAAAEGMKGLALAQQGKWSSASDSLSLALDTFDRLGPPTAIPKAQIASFKTSLTVTNARALYEDGRCKDAEPLLRTAAPYDAFSKQALARNQCNDQAGVKFCFDTEDYCRKP